MKKHLLPPEENWYKANLHCHTTVSDGNFSPERMKEEYKKARLFHRDIHRPSAEG